MSESIQAAIGVADIAKIILGSGVVAAVLGGGFQWIKEIFVKRSELRHEAEIDAIHLISKLDSLAVACANNYWSYHFIADQLRDTHNEHKTPGCSKPSLDLDGVSLDKIKRSIACRIAWLENDVSLGGDIIQSRWEHYLDSDDASDHFANLVGFFGHQALEISKALKKEYGLTYTGENWGMDHIEKRLEQCAAEAREFLKTDD
jgi:hypothetical protein